jgi:hypothetical protein
VHDLRIVSKNIVNLKIKNREIPLFSIFMIFVKEEFGK